MQRALQKVLFMVMLLGCLLTLTAPAAWAASSTTGTTTYTAEGLPFNPTLDGQSSGILDSITLGRNDPVSVVYFIVNILLSLLGLGFLILLLYAGWLWLSARGNEENIAKAKKIILQAIIGFAIILTALGAARLIYALVYSQFVSGTTATTTL